MSKRNTTRGGKMRVMHESRIDTSVIAIKKAEAVAPEDPVLLEIRAKAARFIYRAHFTSKGMSTRDNVTLEVKAIPFIEMTYMDAKIDTGAIVPGQVLCNTRTPELLPTDEAGVVRHCRIPGGTGRSLANALTAFGFRLHDYGAGLEAYALLADNLVLYTWEEGSYLFPGVLMVDEHGEWCVLEVRVREDLRATHGKIATLHLARLSQVPDSDTYAVRISKNTPRTTP